DDDDAGRTAFEKAKVQALIDEANANFTTCRGKTESELEDWYEPAIYADYIQNRFRVSLANPKFRNAAKWCVRMRESFILQGKRWTDTVEWEIKSNIATLVAESPENAVAEAHRETFTSF